MRLVSSAGYAHALAGDVHGVSRHHVPALKEAFGSRFQAAIVVRDPIPRLFSLMALFERLDEFDVWRGNIGYIDEVLAQRGVILPANDHPHRLFAHGVNLLNTIAEEASIARVFRSEDLTARADTLLELVDWCSNGHLGPDAEWAAAAVRTPPVNRHLRTQPALQDWQVEVLRRLVSENTWGHYESLGYSRPGFL
jgi:hypothetical protein